MNQIRCFVAVVDERGFKGAAQALFKSQPAVSLAVRELENLLGTPLFERGSSARLTAFGETFHAIAKRLLADYQRSVRLAVEMANAERGIVRVAAVPSLAREILPQAIAMFVSRHPNVELQVSDGHTQFVRESVLSGDIDLGFCGVVAADPRTAFEEIFADRMGIVCSSIHPFAARKSVGWEELGQQRVIGNGTMRLLDEEFARRIAGQDTSLFIANTTSLLAVVETNVGVTVLPELAYPRENHRLKYVPLVQPRIHRRIGILALQMKSFSPAVASFRQCALEAVVARQPAAGRKRG